MLPWRPGPWRKLFLFLLEASVWEFFCSSQTLDICHLSTYLTTRDRTPGNNASPRLPADPDVSGWITDAMGVLCLNFYTCGVPIVGKTLGMGEIIRGSGNSPSAHCTGADSSSSQSQTSNCYDTLGYDSLSGRAVFFSDDLCSKWESSPASGNCAMRTLQNSTEPCR